MENVDFDAIRHRVKLLEDTGDSRLFDNRDDVQCPVCERPFDEALETERRTEQLSPQSDLSFCLVNGTNRIILFTHATDS